jgi:cation diffusion facilitator family transporter
LQHEAAFNPTHPHNYHTTNLAAERGTIWVMWITALMMVIEIVAGLWFNSMALLADGWHMSSHTLAIGLSAFAYAQARRYAHDARFAFGTWKIEVLAGFASALFLLGVAGMMVFSSIERLIYPQPIQYEDAIYIAALGLAVNLVCALILGRANHHSHAHPHSLSHSQLHGSDQHEEPQFHPEHGAHGAHGGHGKHAHSHHHSSSGDDHQDLNLRSAFIHVLADAMTSVLAIAALGAGLIYGWSWLDPVIGLMGAVLVALWANGLIKDTAVVLLDREMDAPIVKRVQSVLSLMDTTQINDLHIWRVGQRTYSCALSLTTTDPHLTPSLIHLELKKINGLEHLTVEVHHSTELSHR